jgi:hypothetical protein
MLGYTSFDIDAAAKRQDGAIFGQEVIMDLADRGRILKLSI